MCAKGYYLSLMKLREGNVFSRVFLSVSLSTEGYHVTITHDELNLTVQPPSCTRPWLPSPLYRALAHPSLSPASDIWWLVGASKQYASYWNTFLFRFISGRDACQRLVDQYGTPTALLCCLWSTVEYDYTSL